MVYWASSIQQVDMIDTRSKLGTQRVNSTLVRLMCMNSIFTACNVGIQRIRFLFPAAFCLHTIAKQWAKQFLHSTPTNISLKTSNQSIFPMDGPRMASQCILSFYVSLRNIQPIRIPHNHFFFVIIFVQEKDSYFFLLFISSVALIKKIYIIYCAGTDCNSSIRLTNCFFSKRIK